MRIPLEQVNPSVDRAAKEELQLVNFIFQNIYYSHSTCLPCFCFFGFTAIDAEHSK